MKHLSHFAWVLTVVAAAEDELLALATVLVLEDGVSAVTAHVVKSMDLPLLILDQEEVESGHLKTKEATGLG
jgi:hypothetical protein